MKIEFAAEEDKILFLKYAIPCGQILVKRGDYEQSLLDDIKEKTIRHEVENTDPEETFKIAVRMCYLSARKLGKEKIDTDVIREYFWHGHEEAVKWRAEVFRDIRLDACRVYPGQVVFVKDFATVKTKLGSLEFRKDFLPDVQKGDFVITHYDYVIEKIDKETAEELDLTSNS